MKIKRHLSITLILFVIGIIAGAFIYKKIEGWNIIDSFYFVIATITTVGYGDFVPITNTGKIFTMFYSFFGVAVALYVFSAVNSSVFKKHVGAQVSELRRGVKKEEEIKKEVKSTITKAIRKKKR
jgi:voltage-gated potassium channel